MKKYCKHIIFFFMTIIIFSLTVLSCSAIDLKPETTDVVGAVMADDSYELVITGDNINVSKNKTISLKAQVTGVAEQPAVVWKSSDEKVAQVNENGVVKGINIGRTLITATAEVEGQTIEGCFMLNVVDPGNLHKDIFEKYNVLSYRYSYIDDYYYADDKMSWQRYFGFARIYDILAPYIAFEYDYTRVFFNYDEQDFMVQLWKGQYGVALYGGEIGIYNKPASDKDVGLFTFFHIADEKYQPNMEVTIYHQNTDGEWEREFTRDYDKYWWCTGFKVGHLRQVEPADELRLVGRITFVDEEMANRFTHGLIECGFAKSDSKESINIDSFYSEGKDVYLKWQNISEAENTMPLKLGIATLFVLRITAKMISLLVKIGLGGILVYTLFSSGILGV